MKYANSKNIIAWAIIGLIFGFLISPYAVAEENNSSGVRVLAASGSDLQVKLYNYTTRQYEIDDPGTPEVDESKLVTWENTDFSSSPEWAIADQCLEITHTANDPLWGIQIYTDNKNNTTPYAQPYTGYKDPAGLIGQTTTQQSLPMAWMAYKSWTPGTSDIPDLPIVRPFDYGFVGGAWHWLKDKNTPDDSLVGTGAQITAMNIVGGHVVLTFRNVSGALSYNIYGRASLTSGSWEIIEANYPASAGTTTQWTDPNPAGAVAFYTVKVAQATSFVNGEDYITLWNQMGIAVGDRANERTGNPSKTYLFLATNFQTATKQQYKTNTLSLEHFTDSAMGVFPFYVYKEGAPSMQMAYEHINAKMDEYFGQGQLRLIESYSAPYPPGPSGSLEGVAFTYDNAIAIGAYMARPTDENLYRAKILCKSFIWAQENDSAADGRLRDAYMASDEFTGSAPSVATGFNTTTTGNIAWVINALMQYYKNSGDTDTAFMNNALQAAKDAGDFIHTNFYDSSQAGYYYGFNSNGTTLNRAKSTEHNIVAYVAFSHLYDITGEAKWLTRANNAKNFVQNIAWRAAENRYVCGLDASGNPNTDAVVADANLLAVLALGDAQSADIAETIEYVKENFEYTLNHLKGIDFGYDIHEAGADGIWFEGTAELAAAYKVTGHYGYTDRSSTYLEAIKLAQYYDFDGSTLTYTPNYKGIAAASKTQAAGGLTTGLGWYYYASLHVASTAWYAATLLDYNILWGTALDQDVPSPGDNVTFTADTNSLTDDLEYLNSRYTPSGWMNGSNNMYTDARCTDTTYGTTCFKIHYSATAGNDGYKWNALVFQEPENEWQGGTGKGYDLRSATKLKFRIKASRSNFLVRAYLGYAGDSCSVIPFNVINQYLTLTTSWQNVEFDLEALNRSGVTLNMSHVSNGFTIVFDGNNSVDIYIDDIRYETQ